MKAIWNMKVIAKSGDTVLIERHYCFLESKVELTSLTGVDIVQ